MKNIFFLLTLFLDALPFVTISICILKKELVCSLKNAIIRSWGIFIAYDLAIYFTYSAGLYNSTIMVILRLCSCLISWPVLFSLFKKYKIQFLYKCFFALPFMLVILELSALCISYIDTSTWPEFMAITCFRAVFYLLLGYPYYLLEKKIVFPQFDIENKKVWGLFTVSQFILNIAMIVTLRNDYASNGISLKNFTVQLVMTVVSLSMTFLMAYTTKIVRESEVNKDRRIRDEILLEANSRQFEILLQGIRKMQQLKFDIQNNADIPEEINIDFCEKLQINTILEYYFSMAMENKIRVSFDCAALSGCKIPEIDLSIILGNAIENAFNACKDIKEGPKFIKVCTKMSSNHIYITVDNSFSKSSKSYFCNVSLEAVVKKYSGNIKSEIKENCNYLSIELMNQSVGKYTT